MELLALEQVRTLTRRAMLTGMALAAAAPLGCINKEFVKKEAVAPVSTPATQGRVVSAWENKVSYASDSSRGGAAMPVLVGRVYLFGPDMAVPYIGDGSLIVDLYDSSHPNVEPKLIEELRIDPDTLRRLARKDVIGEGYSVIFPWYTYRPEITNVYIIMRYTHGDGKFLIHQSGTFAVDHVETFERVKKGMSVINPAMQVSAALPAQ